MFESKSQRVASRVKFFRRVAFSLALAVAVLAFGLSVGITGYHFIAGLGWIDSLLEASMILGGMGPVNQLASDGVKVFASLYALFSGLVFIAVMGVVLSPIVHRFLHTFHLDAEKSDE